MRSPINCLSTWAFPTGARARARVRAEGLRFGRGLGPLECSQLKDSYLTGYMCLKACLSHYSKDSELNTVHVNNKSETTQTN